MVSRVFHRADPEHFPQVASGVSTYTWEQCNADFDNATWLPAVISCFGYGMCNNIRAGAMAAPEGSPEREGGLAMVAGLEGLCDSLVQSAFETVTLRKAWNPTL
jgi:hypothetical protein